MFTGIIEELGEVESVEKSLGILHLRVRSRIFIDQKIGDSIAVDGACLTISKLKKDLAGFEVIGETQDKTTLKFLKRGDLVNLERSLKIGDRLSGHFVTGHIDCLGKITEVSDTTVQKVSVTPIGKVSDTMLYVANKGSVSLNGVSLTVAEVRKDGFTVCLIPHTIKSTNLGLKKVGDNLNIELDILAKYTFQKPISNTKTSRITQEFLRKKGFC